MIFPSLLLPAAIEIFMKEIFHGVSFHIQYLEDPSTEERGLKIPLTTTNVRFDGTRQRFVTMGGDMNLLSIASELGWVATFA